MDFYTPENESLELNEEIEIDETLKNMLVIGDSISIGYTPVVRELLKGKINVIRPKKNCGDTINGLANIHSWLGNINWDIIHFNWGLHDLCYRHPDALVYGHRDKINGTVSVPPDSYAENLTKLVSTLRGRSRRLIWANTTKIPEGEAGRYVGDDIKYNNIAKKLMNEEQIVINDLYSLTSSFASNMFSCAGDVHFTKEGYRIIGKHVSQVVEKYLD